MTNPPVVGSAVSATQGGGSTLFLPSFVAQAEDVILVWAGGNTVAAVGDANGNSYTLLRTVTVSGTPYYLYIAQNVNPGLTGVYIIFTSGSAETAGAAVVLSQVPTVALDATGTGTTGSSALPQDTITTTVDHDQVLMGVFAKGTPITVGQVSGPIITQASGNGLTIAIASVSTVAPGPMTTQSGLTTTTFWGAIDAAIVGLTSIPPLTALAVAVPTFGYAPLTVQFQGVASGGVAPYTYAWAFNDGGTSAAQNPLHTYINPGNYAAVLTVTDSASNTATSSVVVKVNTPPSPGGGAGGGTGPSPVTQPCVTFIAPSGTLAPSPAQPIIAPVSLENVPSAYYDRCESVWVSPTGTIIGPNLSN